MATESTRTLTAFQGAAPYLLLAVSVAFIIPLSASIYEYNADTTVQEQRFVNVYTINVLFLTVTVATLVVALVMVFLRHRRATPS